MCVMKGICLVVLLVMSFGSYAQTWNEWFRQKKTQIQYLTQQVAGLQMYAGYLDKGYQIAKTGLQKVGDLKNGELDLHQTYVTSFSKINPVIGKDFRISAIIAFQVSISQQYHKCFNKAVSGGMITTGELGYVRSVFSNLLDGCGNEIDDLVAVTTAGQLQLSDDERLKRLDSIYQNMKEKHQFTESFCSEVSELAASRQKAQQEVSNTKTLFNLK